MAGARWLGLLAPGAVGFLATAPVCAQPAQAPPSAAATQQGNDEIVVRADRGDQVRIDRRTYSIRNDPAAQATDMFDVLGRIPSVSVSPSGGVTLLGASGVSVQINNQPVPGNLEQVLRSLHGSDVERIEVITNPGAQYSASFSGGIINIITRQHHERGFTGALNAGVNLMGGYGANVSANESRGPWSFGGRLSYNQSRQSSDSETTRHDLGANTGFHDEGRRNQHGQSAGGGVQVGFQPGAHDRSTLDVGAQHSRTDFALLTYRADLSGAPIYTQRQTVPTTFDFDNLNFGYEHTGARPRQTLKLNIQLSQFNNTEDATTALIPASGTTPSPFTADYRQATGTENVTLDYETPLHGRSFLTTGASFEREQQNVDNALRTLVAPGANDFQAAFSAREQTSAAYATYQLEAGDWIWLPGLRMEDHRLEIVSIGGQNDNNDLRFFPSLHVRRTLTPALDLDLSYTRRIQHPDPSQLDPTVRLFDSTHAGSGNPNLRPTTVDAFEANFNYQRNGRLFSFTFYDRVRHDITSPFFTQVGAVTFSTTINAGDSEQRGLQTILRGRLGAHWRYSMTANALNSAFDVLHNGVTSRRSELEYNGNAQLEWLDPDQNALGADDYVLDLRLQGPRHTLQGDFDQFVVVNLSWRRRLTDRLFSFVQVQDAFAGQDTGRFLRTDTYRERSESFSPGARVRVSLTYQLGRPNERPPQAPQESAAPAGAPQ